MGRTLSEIVNALPKRRRERIDARYRELKDEIESLSELRKLAGKAQAEIAATLKIKQPSVSKIEKQTDMYLSTLRNYVEAIGGELDLVVRLPSRRAMRLNRLGEALGETAKPSRQRRSTGSTRTAQAVAGIRKAERLTLAERDSRRVLELLENPPTAPERLVRAAKAGFRLR
jgi:transcriptional regulator with XRE-family HTH domain